MERFEPSTLAGLVFETSAYTIPPHRPVKRVHAIQPNHKNHRNKRKTPLTKRSIPYLVKACNQLESAPLWIDDSSDLGLLELRAKARRLHAQEKGRGHDGLGMVGNMTITP